MSVQDGLAWRALGELLRRVGLEEGHVALIRLLKRELALESALAELGRVHLLEQALLLREASELKLAQSAGWGVEPDMSGLELSSWKQRCVEALEAATEDGFAVDEQLLRCCLSDAPSWPAASLLAEAALGLHADGAGEFLLARARLAEGEGGQVLETLETLLCRDGGLSFGGALHEVLALVLEQRGEYGRALDLLECAVGLGAGVRAEVSALTLAFVLGDVGRAHSLAEVIDQRTDGPSRGELELILRDTRGRWSGAGRPLRCAPELHAFLLDCICCGGPLLADVCYELLG